VVRRDFTTALRNLLQHGLIGAGSNGAVVKKDYYNQRNGFHSQKQLIPSDSILGGMLGCFGSKSAIPQQANGFQQPPAHAWEVVMHFYNFKVGDPKISTVYNLDS